MRPSLFQIRGVIEGFYGVFYTFPERNDLIQFIGHHGFDFYVYAPKNDRQHRNRWWEPYPDQIMDQFTQTVAIAQEAGVTFCYAISPINSTTHDDFAKLMSKLQSFFNLGVRAFSVLLDDFVCNEQYEANRRIFERYAKSHVDLCNELYQWLQSLDSACHLSVCPAEYYGREPFSDYLHTLGADLDPHIDLCYTGPHVCSPEISTSDAGEFARVTRRAPLIWDNYPVNDLDMKSEMHIGPICGREASLHQVVKGFVINTMLQAEASKIPLLTFADYFDDPHRYEPWSSWRRALREIGGASSHEALSLFAENSLHSCLRTVEAPRLESLTHAALNALKQGERPVNSEALRALELYLHHLDEACYFLKNRMMNLSLRGNLLPWIEALENWIWAGKRAILTLRLMESGGQYEEPFRLMERSIDEINRQTKRIAGNSLLCLAEYVGEQVARRRRAMIDISLVQSADSPESRLGSQEREERSLDAA